MKNLFNNELETLDSFLDRNKRKKNPFPVFRGIRQFNLLYEQNYFIDGISNIILIDKNKEEIERYIVNDFKKLQSETYIDKVVDVLDVIENDTYFTIKIEYLEKN